MLRCAFERFVVRHHVSQSRKQTRDRDMRSQSHVPDRRACFNVRQLLFTGTHPEHESLKFMHSTCYFELIFNIMVLMGVTDRAETWRIFGDFSKGTGQGVATHLVREVGGQGQGNCG